MSSIEQLAQAVEAFTSKSAAEIRAIKSEHEELSQEYKGLAASLNDLAQKSSTTIVGAPGLQGTGPGAGRRKAALGQSLTRDGARPPWRLMPMTCQGSM